MAYGSVVPAQASLGQARRYPDLFRFLVCIVFYQAGVQAVIALAAVYAQQAMHFDTQQTIVLILVVNVAAALVAGLCLGASQSAGRALVGYLSPPARRAEFFGLWGLAVKLSSILGPVTYGLAVWLTGGDHRSAMLSLGAYFVVGLAILAWVDTRRGRRLALRRVSGT